MSTRDPRSARDISVRVGSSSERMRLGIGACRRLDLEPIDRQVLLACAAEFNMHPRTPVWLSQVAELLGLPWGLVWEVFARHGLFDDDEDLWVGMEHVDLHELFDLDDDIVLCSDFHSVRLRPPRVEWAPEFLALALRRWPDDLCALTVDLVATVWNDLEYGFAHAVELLGRVFDCVEPDWWLEPYMEGVKLGRGNLVERAAHLPFSQARPSAARLAAVRRPLSAEDQARFLGLVARRFLSIDLGCLPESVLTCDHTEWHAAGRLLCTIYKRRLPGVTERLEERLFGGDELFEFLADVVEVDAEWLDRAVELVYDMITGSEGGARRFVEVLRARRGYDLPRPLRQALVRRLSLGLGAIVEAVDTATPGLGAEVIAIFGRWREDLDRFVWSQSVGYAEKEVEWRDHCPRTGPCAADGAGA